MLRRNVTFNKHIQPYETGLFMALLKALCWALILINFTNICLVRSSSYQINTLAKIGGLK